MDDKNKQFMYYCFNLYQKLKNSSGENRHVIETDFNKFLNIILEKYNLSDKYSQFLDYDMSNNFQNSEKNNNHYHNIDEIAKKIIIFYDSCSEVTDFSTVIEKFKIKYIEDESRIENNETPEEKEGIGVIYDYICAYDFNRQNFNIFVNSMDIHNKLYSKCVGKEFGGTLRTEQAILFDTDIDVIPPDEAMKRFNEYIGKSNIIMNELDQKNIIEYIEGCLKIIVDLITIQPFSDGNKRTFRSLFNLMMKRRNLPPVYIGNNNRQFSDALLKAMRFNDFEELKLLYMRLICDSIVSLGLEEYQFKNNKVR